MTTRTITLPTDQWKTILEAVQDCWDEGPRGEGWQSSQLSAASAALSTALSQPEPEVAEGPPAVTSSALLHPAYEPDDGSADGAQMVGMAWWRPVMGCDSLQLVVDNARNILRSRWGYPAPPPAPEPGEVAELAAALKADAECVEVEHYDLCNMTAEQMRRAATLLQQLSAIATEDLKND